MESKKYAAIDIGSNAVRLLLMNVFEYEGKVSFKKVSLVRVPLRLGMDAFTKGKISKEKASDFLHTMMAYHHLMKVHKVVDYRACATSAMRNASNGEELVRKIKENTGIEIEIISGKKEAEIIYSTHIEKRLSPASHSFLYIDVGGGSTEISLFSGGKIHASRSFKMGTLRLLNKQVKKGVWEDLEAWIKEKTADFKDLIIIGSGGNINKLYKLMNKKDWKPMYLKELEELTEDLSSMSIDERIVKYKLNPDRADVIVHAAGIFLSAMKWAGIDEIQVPKMGLADGLIKSMHQNLELSEG